MKTIARCGRPALALAFAALLPLAATAQVNPLVKTAAPSRRGYPEGTFPRLQKVAEGVYTYEALRNADSGEQMTTNSLIVITNEGVLVADGQGNLAETQKMVDKIKELTPQPITHIVIGSDHGDHTGGNAAFPRTAKWYAHPTSKAILEGQGGGAAGGGRAAAGGAGAAAAGGAAAGGRAAAGGAAAGGGGGGRAGGAPGGGRGAGGAAAGGAGAGGAGAGAAAGGAGGGRAAGGAGGAPAAAAAPAGPPIVYEAVPERTTIRLGGKEIQLLFLGRMHTGGDLMVYLPADKILFMSEGFLHRVFPAMRSAYPTEWVAAIERAQKMDVNLFIPGHGFVDPAPILKDELEVYRKALLTVIAEGKRLHDAGVPVADAGAQAKYGDLDNWTLKTSQTQTAMGRVYAELNGELPKPPR